MDKKDLRKFYKRKRDLLGDCTVLEKSLFVSEKFLCIPEFKNAKSIFIYMSIGSEFYTRYIINKSLELNKKVAVPVMTGKKHEMVFLPVTDLSELKENRFGILEPPLVFENIVKSDNDTIIVVPALAFDKQKFRIGYGGGFYDCYLSKNKSLLNIILGFDFQLCDDIMHDEFDCGVDKIITENYEI